MIKFKYLFYILFGFIISFINIHKISANNSIQNSKTTISSCSEYFYDTGGIDGNYSDNENYTTTFCPDNDGDVVIVSFGLFELETNYDVLKIYNGSDNTYPLIGEFTGVISPDIIVATIENGGCLTFEFISDFSINFGGWEAYITCETPSSCIAPSELIVTGTTESTASLYITEINNPTATLWEIEYGIDGFILGTGTTLSVDTNNITLTGLAFGTTYKVYVRSICSETEYSNWATPAVFSTNVEPPSCGQVFYDSGSATENYSNNENSTVTICPDNINESITISFISFNLENNYDFLYIYDGNNTTDLIGTYTGTNSPGVISSTLANGGCLTFIFTSDLSITSTGWEAQVYCGDAPSCFMPSEIIVDGVTDNSVYLYITEINSPPATSWNIEYGITGFTKGTGTVFTANSDFTEVIGLSSGTTYDAYVRSICDVNDESIWTSKVTFTTTGVLTNDEYNIDTSFLIFPNPVKDLLTIKLNNYETGVINIFNLEGQLLLTKKGNSKINKLNVANLKKGVYFIKIASKNQLFTKKFIKL
jgi:hypothetical protein